MPEEPGTSKAPGTIWSRSPRVAPSPLPLPILKLEADQIGMPSSPFSLARPERLARYVLLNVQLRSTGRHSAHLPDRREPTREAGMK